ncbi:MAG: aminotransferase class IV [Myxococcales bacterium]|nr:aminotransferase class IV [Myxococcales bacterium]
MSAPTVAWLNGQVVPFSEARVPIEDRGLQFGESLYEVVAVTAGEPRLLAEHAARMSDSAKLLGIESGVPLPERWRDIARELREREQLGEGLLIAQVTGGTAPRTHLPAEPPEPSFFAYLRPFHFPRGDEVARGIRAITRPDVRWALSDLKTSMLLPAVMARREAAARGAAEALFVGEDGNVREGAASNVFLIEHDRLLTPARSHHLLPGLTGPLVEGLARRLGLEVGAAEIPVERLLRAGEVFVTSTTLLVMPVVAIDGHAVGAGCPGPRSEALAALLREAWKLG